MTLTSSNHRSTSYNIEQLIREVELRPAIWNKNYDGYTKRRLKSRMWEELCETLVDNWKQLNATQKHRVSCEVQKKWRNVKDSFKKEIHKERKTSEGHTKRKKRRYLHYDALSFLAAGELYRNGNIVSLDGSEEESDNTSIDQENIAIDNLKRTRKDTADEHDILIKIKSEQFNLDEESKYSEFNNLNADNKSDNLTNELEKSTIAEENSNFSHKKKFEKKFSCSESHFIGLPRDDNWDNDENSEIVSRKHEDYNHFRSHLDFKVYDEDVSFTEMMVPMLRKLTDDQKHFAKIEIMNILYKAKSYHQDSSVETHTNPIIPDATINNIN